MSDSLDKRAFIPLSVPHLGGREGEYVQQCIDTEWVSSAGAFVNRFEDDIVNYTGSQFAIACVNGTAALHLSLLMAGVAPGNHVLVPSLTFIAPVNTVRYCNADPIFLDCDEFYNIDVDKLRRFLESETKFEDDCCIFKQTGQKISAIVPVHVFGGAVDMEALSTLCLEYKIPIVEDATESLGTRYKRGRLKGRHTGTIGQFGCLSFNGNKIITCGGGGIILTDNEVAAKKLKYLSEQAKDDEQFFIHNEVGFNYRLTNIQAAIGVAQLEQLEQIILRKKDNFQRYKKNLTNTSRLKLIDFPPYCDSNHWFYSVQIDGYNRKNLRALISKLGSCNIQARPVWELNNRQEPYRNYHSFEISKATELCEKTLNIPCSSNLTSNEVDYVCEKLIKETQ
ncbi:MAG: LegC family aminotransferase [Candidatus Cloacimonetes bacterium]|nr:LegC family aminotransferase [Candidatus Cloacimonadota bacterium]